METNKIKASKWFIKNYLGIYLVLGLILPITGIYFLATNSLLEGLVTTILSSVIAVLTFKSYVRTHYFNTVIKFKSVERWKSNFLHLLFLPPVKKR